jgi:hypothetical protein
MFFGILFNAFTALGEISQQYSQRPIIVGFPACPFLTDSKNTKHKRSIVPALMRSQHI